MIPGTDSGHPMRFKVVGKTPRRAPNGRFQRSGLLVKRDKEGELAVQTVYMRDAYEITKKAAK